MKHYFGSGGRRPGELILPDPQQLKLYMAMARCDNEKAARLIGYHPRFDFTSGMEPTRRYLQWAYSDLQRSVTASLRASPAENDSTQADVAHVG
jgi:hypothetical protein